MMHVAGMAKSKEEVWMERIGTLRKHVSFGCQQSLGLKAHLNEEKGDGTTRKETVSKSCAGTASRPAHQKGLVNR